MIPHVTDMGYVMRVCANVTGVGAVSHVPKNSPQVVLTHATIKVDWTQLQNNAFVTLGGQGQLAP